MDGSAMVVWCPPSIVVRAVHKKVDKMKQNNKPLSPAEKDDWPPLPLPDNYKNASDPKFATDLYDAIRRYRLIYYEPSLPINAGQYKYAFDSCLEIRNEFPELKEVPRTKNPYSPNEFDFMDLEQWLLTAIEYEQNYYYAESQNNPEEEPALLEDEVEILDYLYQEFPTIRYMQDINAIFPKSRDHKTLKVMLDGMIQKNLVSRPPNRAKGYIITSYGRDYHSKYYT